MGFLKCQNTIETSIYGLELMASRISTELIIEVWFVLRSLGIGVSSGNHTHKPAEKLIHDTVYF
jgi:hypothetical protein